MITANAFQQLTTFVQVWVRLTHVNESENKVYNNQTTNSNGFPNEKRVSTEGSKVNSASELTVKPKDLISILLGVLNHRLRMKPVVKDKSLFWGSEKEALERERKLMKNEGRGGVEGILKEIVGIV